MTIIKIIQKCNVRAFSNYLLFVYMAYSLITNIPSFHCILQDILQNSNTEPQINLFLNELCVY